MGGCGRRLAEGQYWSFCGETDMGQTAPFLCTECGGTGILHKENVEKKVKSLFNEYEAYTSIGSEISDKAYLFMKELLKEYSDNLVFEIEKIVINSVSLASSLERINKSCELRRNV